MVVVVVVIVTLGLLFYMLKSKPSSATTTDIVKGMPDTTDKASDIAAQQEIEMAVQAGYEEQAQVSHLDAAARNLSPMAEAKEEAMDSLTMALEAKASGDYSKLLGSYWAAGYNKDLPPEKIAEDIERAAKSAIKYSVASDVTNRAITNKSTTGTVSKAEIEATKGVLITDSKGNVYQQVAGGYGYIQVGVMEK